MADHLGLDRKMISRYETDRTPIRMAYLRLWAELCGVSVAWIVNGKAEEPEPEVPQKVRKSRKTVTPGMYVPYPNAPSAPLVTPGRRKAA